MKAAVFILFALGSLFIGLSAAAFGWIGLVFILSVAVPILLVLIEYRIGLLALVILMPFAGAQFIPKVGPFSLINVLLLGLCVMFILRIVLSRMVGRRIDVPVPASLVWLFFVPVTIGFLNGSIHLSEIPQHMVFAFDGKIGQLRDYWISLYFKNMLMVFATFILASAIIEYGHAKRYAITIVLSGVIFILIGVLLFVSSGRSLEAAVYSRHMFDVLGRNANSMAVTVLPVLGASLFMRDAVRSRWGRSALLTSSIILIAGILITGSRGGMLGMIVVVGYYLWKSRNIRQLVLVISIIAASIVLTPEVIFDRLLMGVSSAVESRGISESKDELTSGRVFLYGQLLPDLLRNPLIGNGITSTHWSTFVKSGNVLGQPHNLYLTFLLDLGLIGFVLIMAFYLHLYKTYKELAKDHRLDPMIRAYFGGAIAGLLGYLTWGMSSGDAFPSIEQWFLWLSIGMAIGCRSRLIILSDIDANAKSSEVPSSRSSLTTPPAVFWQP